MGHTQDGTRRKAEHRHESRITPLVSLIVLLVYFDETRVHSTPHHMYMQKDGPIHKSKFERDFGYIPYHASITIDTSGCVVLYGACQSGASGVRVCCRLSCVCESDRPVRTLDMLPLLASCCVLCQKYRIYTLLLSCLSSKKQMPCGQVNDNVRIANRFGNAQLTNQGVVCSSFHCRASAARCVCGVS